MGLSQLGNALIEGLNALIQTVQLIEQFLQHEAMMGTNLASQGFDQLRNLAKLNCVSQVRVLEGALDVGWRRDFVAWQNRIKTSHCAEKPGSPPSLDSVDDARGEPDLIC